MPLTGCVEGRKRWAMTCLLVYLHLGWALGDQAGRSTAIRTRISECRTVKGESVSSHEGECSVAT